MMNGKVLETLQSRKFWITQLVSAGAVTLYTLGEIDIDKTLAVVALAEGIYVGGLSVEDGLKKFAPILAELIKPLLADFLKGKNISISYGDGRE